MAPPDAHRMLPPEYFQSLTQEVTALKNRVRHFIRDSHWLTDGEWKESVLRSILRRQLPRTIEVGRGFVLTPRGQSKQIDILLYYASKPVLFRDGDLVFVTADAVAAVIEVKTAPSRSGIASALARLSDHSDLIRSQFPAGKFFGLFAYEDSAGDVTSVLEAIRDSVNGAGSRIIDCVCLGGARFIRYWNLDPDHARSLYDKWRAYDIPLEAPGYFIHNVIEGVSLESVQANGALWYPPRGKEHGFVAEIAWRSPQEPDS